MAERINLSREEKDAVLREAGYRCAVPTCNTTLAIDIHHIIEVFKGGGNALENLVALCPTCHALYHRGTITGDSIRHWKERLVMLNKSPNIQSDIVARVQQAIEQKKSERPSNEQRTGFALAANEFSWRTCEAGFVYGDNRFVGTGFCCFIAPKLAITATEVVDWATEIGHVRGGSPAILTLRGLAPFVVRERFDDLGGVATIEMGEIDDHYVTETLSKEPDIARFLHAPLQTPVRVRSRPFWGERVAFIHSSDDTKEYRGGMDFQFDSADVAFHLSREHKIEVFQYVLTPVVSRVQHRGSPVFAEDGCLIGVIKDSILVKGEGIYRPVVSGAFVLSDRMQAKAE
jgi:hypothetical protein